MKPDDRSEVGRNIRRLRRARGWSQEHLAERASISSVKMIETGKRKGRIDTLQKIAGALGCSVREFFGDGSTDAWTDELDAFLNSPMARDVTEVEVLYLQGIALPGRIMTAESYYNALQMIRASLPSSISPLQ